MHTAEYEDIGLYCRVRDGMNPLIPILRSIADSLEEYDMQQERALKEYLEARKHPGMVRFKDVSEFWDEVKKANSDQEAEQIRQLVQKYVGEALTGWV